MIKVNNISLSYGPVKVLDDVSLVINKGESVSIIGHTGSGKSSLIHCIAGLTPCSSGTISIDGEIINDVSSKVGMVFNGESLFPHLTILQNMTLAPVHVYGMSIEEAEEKAYKLLKKVGMRERSNCYPHELSPGQKQRVAIARSLIIDPEYLLLDEPTSSLDPISESAIADIIRKLKKEKITIVLISHKINLVRELSDRVIFMHDGKICETGNPHEIIDNPQNKHTKAYMNHSNNLVYKIKSTQYDYLELNARIEQYCDKYRLGKEELHSVQLVVEELLNILPLDEGVILSIAKSADEGSLTVDAIVKDKGIEYLTPDMDGNLSYMIISGMCKKISEYINEDRLRNIHLEI